MKDKFYVILGHKIKVRFVHQKDPRIGGNDGLYDPNKKEIYVSNANPKIEQQLAEAHELIHCFIDIIQADEMFTIKQEEALVDFLEHPMYSFMKNNTKCYDK